MTETKKGSSLVKLVVTLCLISAITAGLLGLVNRITAPNIAAFAAQTAQAAKEEVLKADSYDEVEVPAGHPNVAALYKAGDAGYVANVNIGGSQGNIELMIGVDNDLVVTGVSIIKSAETAGLGAKATEPEWRAQFIGLSAPVAVTNDGGQVQAITASTITSRAVCNAVNAAIAAVAEIA